MTSKESKAPMAAVEGSAECPDKAEVACEQCKLYGFLRLFESMHLESMNRFLTRQRPVAKGELLFEAGASFHGIYAVKRGSFKSYAWLDQEVEQVLGFALPGELLGLDAIGTGLYGCQTVALESSSVCLMPFSDPGVLGAQWLAFQEQVIRVLADQVRHDQRQTFLVGRRSAEERLGAFLLNLADRFVRHGFAGQAFPLPMLQNDIANYLGLSIETVSRTLKSFREQHLVDVHGRRVRILDFVRLRAMTQFGPSEVVVGQEGGGLD